MLYIANDKAAIGISERDGSIVLLKDLERQFVYCSGRGTFPFQIDKGYGLKAYKSKFSYSVKSETQYELVWKLESSIIMHATVKLDDELGDIVFKSQVENLGLEHIYAVKYPIIGNLGPITDGGEDDYLVHPYATGVKVHNPYKNFSESRKGFPDMPYPESFSGCSMQFIYYYGENRAGLYAAAYDGNFSVKWLNFSKNGNSLELSHMYGYDDIASGNGVCQDWRFVINMLSGRDWYEAADIYKKWAVKQIWCSRGPLAQRTDGEKPKWLLEKVGLATFGINARYDRERWIRAYHRLTGTGVFHVTGPDWPKSGQDYMSHICGGYDDWFPVNFNDKNIAAIRGQGDFFAPFEFDCITSVKGADHESIKRNLMKFPRDKHSIDRYDFNVLCPFTEYTKKLHIGRDMELVKETGCDALYYDISANNLLHICMSGDHGHGRGGSGHITEAFRRNYMDTRDMVTKESKKYVPIGTEMMNEVFLDCVDFYQARGWAEPASAFETGEFRGLVKSGEMKLIPLFTYVYHEYGAQRLDGWGKLVEEIGELFYHTVAKTYLWGGIYELNYEYSPMEVIDGAENSPDEHYCRFNKEGYGLSEERAAYIAQFAELRTGRGNKYLAYGRMLPPVSVESLQYGFSWMHYNCNEKWSEYHDQGKYQEDAIVTSAWISCDGDDSLGIFIANTAPFQIRARFSMDISRYGLAGEYSCRLVSSFSRDTEDDAENARVLVPDSAASFDLCLEPRKALMLELNKIILNNSGGNYGQKLQ